MSTITCPVCGTQSEAGKKFCAECGAALPLACPACGHVVTATQKFCAECGTPLRRAFPARDALTAPQPQAVAALAAEERRLITALFCDLVGFTPLSEQLDPEEVRDIQADYFSAMSQQIERYGGIVEKYAGDAVLALFGAPIAHEDDAERAVLCALGMQAAIAPVAATARSRWNVEPALRVGVNTGEVVSGTWDASGRQDVAVTGDALNTAARLQAAAEPGQVVVGAGTMRLTRRRIRYGPGRDLMLKGKQAAFPAYAALGIREGVGERWEEAPRVSPLVGRDRELIGLLDAWMRVQGGEGQLLTLVGEPGVGKSRLVAEVLEKLSSADSTIRIVRARCLSYGQEISLWLLSDLLRSLFGIREQDGLDEVRMKLESVIRALLAGADETYQTEGMDVLGEMLGLPAGESLVTRAGPEIRRQALLRSLRLLLGTLSEGIPTILVLEDLHWIDAASEEVLKEVVADVPGLRMLVLVTQRPGWNAPWSEWGWTERLTLRPLREADAALLAGAVLGGMTLSPVLERYVAERAGGNPFFVEEMLRALEEGGGLEERDGVMRLAPGAAERLPTTLTEILLARLDRLESRVRTVAQVGSVIGRSFAVRLLAQVMEREQAALDLPLSALQQAEIAFPRRGTDLEYVFKHVSMREVAYNTLVTRRRQELHLATARAIAALYPADEYVEVIAYHYGKTDAPEAADWLERAGDRAAAVYASETAIAHYQEAQKRREPVRDAPTGIARIDEKLGEVFLTLGRSDDAIPALERSVEIYRENRDLEGAGRATASLGKALVASGNTQEGLSRVEPWVELLAGSGPSPALASLHLALGTIFQTLGRYEEAQAASERAAEIARTIGDERLLASAIGASTFNLLGRYEEARAVLEEAVRLLERVGDLRRLIHALTNLGEAHRLLGEMRDARHYNERALEMAERIGNRPSVAFSLMNLGEILLTLGEWEGARQYLERAGEVIAALPSTNSTAPYPPAILGEVLLAMGSWDEAEAELERALDLAEASEDRHPLELIHSALAELEIRRGEPEAAINRLESLAGWEGGYRVLIDTTLAWALLDAGEKTRAGEVATETVARARAQDERLALVDALRVQGMALRQQGHDEQAAGIFEEGLALARSLPYPYAEARILAEMGMLKEGLTIFRRLGAQKEIVRCQDLLSTLSN
jgi:class 3 adenylate cyclase/tetratricopeptide (TPR) repeat protein